MASNAVDEDVSLANMRIGKKPPEQEQQHPSQNVCNISKTDISASANNPYKTTAPAPPATSQPNQVPLSPPQMPQSGFQPGTQPMNSYPQPQQQALYQQPPISTQYQTYPQVTPQAQTPTQYQYAPPTTNVPPPPPMQAPTPASPQLSPPSHQAATQAMAPALTPTDQKVVNYDPFGISVNAAPAGLTSPDSVADPFAPPPIPIAPPTDFCSTERDDSPPPQRPTNAPQCATLEIRDVHEESTGSVIDVEDDEADFWAQMGFAVEEKPATDAGKAESSTNKRRSIRASIVRSVPKVASQKENGENKKPADPNAVDEKGMPAGGKYYDATLSSGEFGAILLSTKQVRKNIYCTASQPYIKALGNRPVVAYVSNNSIVDSAGISVGDVLLEVQDEKVNVPKLAMTCIHRERKRRDCSGVDLALWKPPPSINVTLAENQCMVEYHIRSTNVPTTSFEWKSKYVVVGGIVAEPWVINMYYGKRDYDKAVSEIHAHRSRVSVKVKSWSLFGAQLLTPKPKVVHYTTKRRPWYYFILVTHKGKAIKISHPMLDGLKPVLEGVKRAIKYNPYENGN